MARTVYHRNWKISLLVNEVYAIKIHYLYYGTPITGNWGSELRAGSIIISLEMQSQTPLLWMTKYPWTRHWNPNCSQCVNVCAYEFLMSRLAHRVVVAVLEEVCSCHYCVNVSERGRILCLKAYSLRRINQYISVRYTLFCLSVLLWQFSFLRSLMKRELNLMRQVQ